MPDFQEMLDGARLRELPVPIALDGIASAELDALEAEFEGLGEWESTSMGDVNPAIDLIARIEAARAKVRTSVVTLRFRAMGSRKYSSLVAAHPAPEGSDERYDPTTFLPVLLATCCIEPVMSQPQVMVLLDTVNGGQAQQMYDAALAVNEEPSPIPF